MTLVIIAGGIDLSVGSVMGLASVVATIAVVQNIADQTHWIVMVVVALAVGLAAGLINGVVIAYGKVVAFMATLAMLVAARGLAEILAERRTLQVGDRGLHRVHERSTSSASTSSSGSSRSSPRSAGCCSTAPPSAAAPSRSAATAKPRASRASTCKRHTMWLYAISGLCAGIAAVMILGRTTAGTSTHGQLYELDAIAAVVVGGTLLVGGRGTITGTVFGVLIFATLTNVFVQNNLTSSVQAVAKGIIIVIAVLLQQRFAKPTGRAT